MNTITIPLHYLHELFTGDSPPQLAGTKLQSQVPNFPEGAYLIRWELGALLSKLDPNEELFHIELYPSIQDQQQSNLPTSHAELYTTFVWQNSYAKTYNARRKLQQSNQPAAPQSTARTRAYQEMVKTLTAQKIPAGNAAQVAEIIAMKYSVDSKENEFIIRLADAYRVRHILKALEDEINSTP